MRRKIADLQPSVRFLRNTAPTLRDREIPSVLFAIGRMGAPIIGEGWIFQYLHQSPRPEKRPELGGSLLSSLISPSVI